MAIEHRLGMREAIQRRVCVYRPRTRAVFGHCANISSSGMYVRTRTNDLPVNSKVQLVTVWREMGVFRLHRVAAIVTRVEQGGIGLMFTDPDPRAVFRLRLLMRNEADAKAAKPTPVPGRWALFPSLSEGQDS